MRLGRINDSKQEANIIHRLRVINEGGRFDLKHDRRWHGDDEATKNAKALKKQDEDLFQTARL